MTRTVHDYINALPQTQREIATQLLDLIETALPDTGAMWHGHPVWSLGPTPGKQPVCLIKSHPAHLTFAFWRGQEINDPSGRLQPGTRSMASTKLRNPKDLDHDLFATWLQQAKSLETA